MDKTQIVKKLVAQFSTKKAKDYTYITLFFVVFSIFIFFAIRPSLTTAFALIKEEQDLNRINDDYEQVITRIVQIQATMEKVRDKLFVLPEALPTSPRVNKILQDIETSGAASGIVLSDVSVGEVNLVEKNKGTTRQLAVNVETISTFEGALNFITALSSQRRVKYVKSLEISHDEKAATGGGQLNIKMIVEGYYL